jgi:polyferredoxin
MIANETMPEQQVKCVDSPCAARGRKFIRRTSRDYSQLLRRLIQWTFVALNLWIGVEFYRFTIHYESAVAIAAPTRPAGVEGWLPIASLMNLKYWLFTGQFPTVHPAGLVLLLTFVVISLVWGKSFCSWLCPIGTLSEALWRLGKRLFKKNYHPPRWVDIALRSLKYILFGLFLLAVGSMSAAAIESFLGGPYGIIADVKMLNFFRHLSLTTAVVLMLLAAASLFIQNFWCRYLCPYGALLAFPTLLSPGKIRRNADSCIDCAKCAKACPARLPVDKLLVVRSAECTSCLECVAVCPVKDTLQMSFTSKKRVPEWMVAASLVAIFLLMVGWAKWTGHWNSPIPDDLYYKLIPQADLFSHP